MASSAAATGVRGADRPVRPRWRRPRPGHRHDAPPGGGRGPMITSRTKKQLLVFVIITLRRRLLRGRPLRPAGPAVLRLLLHRERALRAVRRHLHRRRGHLPRRGHRAGLGHEADRRRRRRDAVRREQVRQDPDRLRSRWSATSRPSASSTSSCSRRRDGGPYLEGRARRSSTPRHRDPGVDHRDPDQPRQHRRSRCRRPTCAPSSPSPVPRSRTPARASARSSTPRTPSSRPPTPTSTPPRR